MPSRAMPADRTNRPDGHPVDVLNATIKRLRQEFSDRNPLSRRAAVEAKRALPGGSTRSVLFYQPFPLTILSGEGAEVIDLDGHVYTDFVGEFSAGLYGHSDPIIRNAIIEALDGGIVLAGPNIYEARFAEAITARFTSIEQLRFCNSGTEANTLALVTARHVTGRSKIMVFDGAYHGGVLVFPPGGNALNLPFDFVIAPYNDAQAATDLIRRHASDLAAVIVEPILGAGGNLPGTTEFLETLRRETQANGALLIFDEVKTSRCGAAGIQGMLGIAPDLTTLGKYLGGGLPSGAFGGRRDIMALFDPMTGSLRHAGTFNNNVCSMAAGLAGLTRVFTTERAARFQDEGDQMRRHFQAVADASATPLSFTGLGSFFTMHLGGKRLEKASDVTPLSRQVGLLFHMYAALNGIVLAGRGDLYQSLPMTEGHRASAATVLSDFIAEHGALIADLAQENS